MNRGAFELTPATPVRYAAGSPGEQVASYFVDLMKRTRGVALAASAGETGGEQAISFVLQAREGSQVEEGVFAACVPRANRRFLAQPSRPFLWRSDVVAARQRTTRISRRSQIEDAPRFRWRGLMLDSARHYQSPQFIERLIDAMALHKLNVLHWHLTDDQAWRLEIKKYPKLTEVGAWRVPAGPAAAADIDPATGKPRLYGGFYTQDEVREIVAYAAARHITIVPEIEMPGHASAAIAAYPQLGVAGKPSRRCPPTGASIRTCSTSRSRRSRFSRTCSTKSWSCSRASTSTSAATRRSRISGRRRRACRARMRELGVQGRARAAELLRPADGEVPQRARPPADRLGRDPRRRSRAERDRDVLARHRGRGRGGCGGSRRRAVAGADAVLRQSSAGYAAPAGSRSAS